ncbi:o-succinylbenzoate synthase [Metabacillus fastidiosus]|uniref:o-succinylbenzoate synthase n=1 Tax=Metabacillus fastidiosus TaxID=1458 RepID=UPI002DBA9968|nr:o-succinylbenzoate synthase [Metabacillus fastidiosus]MEC2077962.1 o-succinylbenzoate synthase [Metabacillus fastidiosus]
MEINRIILRHLKMDLLHPFTTSTGTEADKDFVLVEVQSKSGLSGWAESVAIFSPLYNEETFKTNWHIIDDFLIPLLLQAPINHPDELIERFSSVRGNYMAKAALEGAVWDLYAKENKMSLSKALGGTKDKIEVGISIGIQESEKALLKQVESYVSQGYKRIKIKIKPGFDYELLQAVRKEFPTIPMMADANSAYSLHNIDRLKALDELNLMMIEQPLAHDDIIDHAELQAQLKTPICLDESIHTVEDVRKAIQLGSCKIINIKIGRVGGLSESKRIHDLCAKHDVPVWCGGMLEAGIGRAHNIAITTLPNFTLPGDTAASSRYWAEDIITPEVEVKDGYIYLPEGFGIGYEPNLDNINKFTLESKIINSII